MAVYLIRTEFAATSGLPADIVTSNLHFETIEGDPTADVGLALIGHVAAAYETIQAPGTVKPSTLLSASLSRAVMPVGKAYEGDQVGLMGSPLATAAWAGFSAPVAGSPLPDEVACCLSFRKDYGNVLEVAADGPDADNDPDRPRARQRGRLYFGPLQNAATVLQGTPAAPASGLINALLGMGVFLANPTNPTLTDVQAHWVINGKNGIKEVDTVWVDNAFDTQRRRGRKATTRTFQVV